MAAQKPVLKKTRHLQFIASMKSAQQQKDVEKAVENGYNSYLKDYYNNHPGYKKAHIEHSYPHNTDGVITIGGTLALDGSGDDERKILIEAKKDLDFMGKRSDIARVLTQVVFYLKKFQNAGQVIPKVVICGDNDEIFAAPTTLVRHYLDNDYDWSVAPSESYVRVPELYNALLEDKNIRPYIRVIDENFDGEAFLQSVDAYLNEKPLKKEPVTTANLERLFMDFSWRIFGGEKSVKNQTQIDIFINGLKGSENVFPHPIKPNVIMLNGKEFSGNSEAFVSFWNHYDSNNYSLAELKSITEIADTLIEEFDRRFTGDFWTPKIWGDEAHNMIERNLGEDWRDNYFVWDPACGAKNLTRDYHFSKGLYSTTLHSEELSISDQYNTGENEHAFQYDFLNDDMLIHEIIAAGGTKDDIMARAHELKLVQSGGMGLLQALYDNEPIVFFANPPYGQATSGQGNMHKSGTSKDTKVAQMMTGLGHARMELYTQFIFRVQKIAEAFEYKDNFHFFFFNKGFLTSPNFSVFTNNLKNQFIYEEGFMLNAGEFQGTSSAWSVIFSGWSIKNPDTYYDPQNVLYFDVKRSTPDGCSIESISTWKAISNKEDISKWSRELNKFSLLSVDYPVTKNGFDSPDQPNTRCKMYDGWIGYFAQDASNVQGSDKYLGIYSFGLKRGNGATVTPDNLTRVAVTFSIRRSVQEKIADQKLLWVRDKDIFTRPSDTLANNTSFTHDCMVYSLFDRQSNQTSLRNYEYNGVKYRVENEFFPFSRDFITSLASKDGQKNLSIEQDMMQDKNPRRERIVHTWLQGHSDDMTPEGKRLLDAATAIWEHSFKYRKDYIENSRYQLNSWDAGWKQIYFMCFSKSADLRAKSDVELQNAYIEFKDARRALGMKIAQMAEEDGVI